MGNFIKGLSACLGIGAFLALPFLSEKLMERPLRYIELDRGRGREAVCFYENGRADYYHFMGSLNHIVRDSDGDNRIDSGCSYVMVPSTIGVFPLLLPDSRKKEIEKCFKKYRLNTKEDN